MRGETEKGKHELEVFLQFAERAPIGLVPGTARKGNATQGEPDIYCELQTGPWYFELAEACAPEFASAFSKVAKTGQDEVVWGNDVTEKTLMKKLKKTYKVSCPVDLLLYTNARTALPDNVILPKLEPILANGMGQFNRVWFLGDGLQLIAEAS